MIGDPMFKYLLGTSVLLLALVGSVVSAQQGVEFSGLAHKVLSGPDSDGDLLISIKLNARNATDIDQDAKVVVRAVDKDDYEVFDVQLIGKVKAGQMRILTDTQFINEKVYKSIVRWEIEE